MTSRRGGLHRSLLPRLTSLLLLRCFLVAVVDLAHLLGDSYDGKPEAPKRSIAG